MRTPQQYIWDWAFANDHRIFTALDKEQYWLVWTNGDQSTGVWNFEHNNLRSVPDYAYNKIIKVMEKAGYRYYAN